MSKLNGSSGEPSGGDFIALQWGTMVAAAMEGEVVGIEDKHGETVAVMLGIANWSHIVNELERLTNRIELLGGGET